MQVLVNLTESVAALRAALNQLHAIVMTRAAPPDWMFGDGDQAAAQPHRPRNLWTWTTRCHTVGSVRVARIVLVAAAGCLALPSAALAASGTSTVPPTGEPVEFGAWTGVRFRILIDPDWLAADEDHV